MTPEAQESIPMTDREADVIAVAEAICRADGSNDCPCSGHCPAAISEARSALSTLEGRGWGKIPQFDAMQPAQEALAIAFCEEIAGKRGHKGSPPDPIRLLEMAEELYRAECAPSPPEGTDKS